jgi:hypothetical protein
MQRLPGAATTDNGAAQTIVTVPVMSLQPRPDRNATEWIYEPMARESTLSLFGPVKMN